MGSNFDQPNDGPAQQRMLILKEHKWEVPVAKNPTKF